MGGAFKSGDLVLDPGALEQLRAIQRPGRPDIVARVIALFRIEAPKQLETIESAVISGAFAEMHHAAHSLKSSAANIGAHELRDACEKIERGIVDQDFDLARARAQELRDLLPPVLKALSEEEAI